MPYDEGLAQRVRAELDGLPGFVEKKMFGGVGYMLRGNLACGVNKNNLIVRLHPEQAAEALAKPHVRVFDMTGRPMAGWIVVEPAGLETPAALKRWVELGVEYALSLPEK